MKFLKEKNMMKKAVTSLLPVSILSVVTVIIFLPSTLYLGNSEEFTVSYYQILPIIVLTCIIVYLIENIVAVLLSGHSIAFAVYRNLILGLTLGVYIQSNFLNDCLQTLDGKTVDWNYTGRDALYSIVAWSLCIIIPQVIGGLKVPKFKWEVISNYAAYFLVATQMLTLLILLMTPKDSRLDGGLLSKAGEFELSPEENVIVFVVDTLDAQWAEDYGLNDPEYMEIYEDFVYFDNVVAGGAPTQLGIAALLTGKLMENPHEINSAWDYLESAYENCTLFQDLKNNDWTVRIFSSKQYLEYADVKNMDNYYATGGYVIFDKTGFAKCLYKLVAYNAMPYHVKRYFWLYGEDFSEYVRAREADAYTFDDPLFYKELREEHLSLGDDKKVFNFYHLNGAHYPYKMDENCERLDDGFTTVDQQVRGTFRLLGEYLEQMKELGVYDSSTIIITGDHGGKLLFQNPAVLIKKPYSNHEGCPEVNSAPATFENVRASMLEALLGEESDHGKTLFDDLSENEINGRYHTAPGMFRQSCFGDITGWDEPTGFGFDRYIIGSPARDIHVIRDAEE